MHQMSKAQTHKYTINTHYVSLILIFFPSSFKGKTHLFPFLTNTKVLDELTKFITSSTLKECALLEQKQFKKKKTRLYPGIHLTLLF